MINSKEVHDLSGFQPKIYTFNTPNEKAELAAFLVQREQIYKQQELDSKIQALKAEQAELELDLKFKIPLARSQGLYSET